MKLRLVDLDPQFVRHTPTGHQDVVDLSTAQGITFLCPGCFQKNGGEVGTHSLLVWFKDRGVPDGAEPGPGRWTVSGMSVADLTLSPSVDAKCWHGHVVGGTVR